MTHKPIELLTVFLEMGERRKVGRLATQNRRLYFEYDAAFTASGIQISPFRLPLKPGLTASDPGLFDGLFGVFNDSLPDGWGRLLRDRAVGEGKSPGPVHLRALARKHAIKNAEAVIERVQTAVARWKVYAGEAGVGKASTDMIWKSLESIAGSARLAVPEPKAKKKETKKKPAKTASRKRPGAGRGGQF